MTTTAKKPFDADSHRFGMAYDRGDGQIVHVVNYSPSLKQAAFNHPSGTLIWGDCSLFTRAPKHDLIPRADVAKLVDAVRTVVEDGVQETSGQFSSHKNNKCRHGNFGYEGCGNCTDEYLAKALADFNALHGVVKSD
ncbi:hypothetical protein LZG74_25365 [Dyadobacter sp. CY327]|uniref:hypothetical protein n=1 Tax=Dyadobacter sp. CY327 TaxID=2907301 RepID=UPI001F163E4D|nr:hypothetical protein [Dyadobacter sp. CY327]MCE7073664.1 hypothetical protein [Dyadobacter sp. CY327]